MARIMIREDEPNAVVSEQIKMGSSCACEITHYIPQEIELRSLPM